MNGSAGFTQVRTGEPQSPPFPVSVTFFLFFAFFLSGANCLVYEIVFRRQLLLSLGVSHYSVGTVLAVFMAGLGLGGYLFGGIADRARNPLLHFGYLEAGTGILGILILQLFPAVDILYAGLVRTLGAGSDAGAAAGESPNVILKALISGGLLLPPAVLMGGTLPMLGKTLTTGSRAPGRTVGLLYGVNTLGGVAGSAGVTFFLLGALGARKTLAAVSALGIAIGLAAGLMAVRKGSGEGFSLAGRKGDHPSLTGGTLALGAVFVTGFVGLSLEVYWTRILAYIIGSHGYAFGVILATFLAGIALGSLVASRLGVLRSSGGGRIDPHGQGAPSYVYVERMRALGYTLASLGAAVFAASLALYRLRHLAEWLNASAAGSWSRFIALEACTVFAILLLPTFLLGAAYPIALSIVAEGPARVGRSVGRVAALNTLGSILGALTSGFVLMPLIGITGGLRTLIALSLAFGVFLLASSALRRGDPVPNPARARRRVRGSLARAFGASAAAALAAMLLGGPRMGPALQALGDDERLLSYEEASPATVAVRENGMGERMLAVNGLDEVPVDVSSLLTFRMLAHLPLLLHPRPREVMVLSLGGAITTGSVSTHGVERIDAVELCRPVVKAAELFEPWNHGVLGDGRLRVIIQDGRNHLLTTDERYDVITADATHPWSADSWILYTREFYGLVKERLSEGGLFCQWVPLHWLSPEDYRCILRTMHSVFPEMSLWYTGSYTVALAGRGKLGIDPARIAERMGSPGVKADLASVGIESVGSLLGLFLMSGGGIEKFTANGALTPSASSPGAPAPGPLNTDDLAYLEHSASRCYGRETSPENLLSLLRFKQGPEAIPAAPGAVDRLGDFLKAREKLMLGRMAVYDGNFERAIRFYDYALTFAPDDGLSRMFLDDVRMTLAAQRAALGDALGKAGDTEEARRAYEEALEIDPGEPAAHHGAGLELLSRGEYLAALDHFDKAIERRSRDPALRASRAEALAALGRTGEAERERDEIKLLERGMKGYGAR